MVKTKLRCGSKIKNQFRPDHIYRPKVKIAIKYLILGILQTFQYGANQV